MVEEIWRTVIVNGEPYENYQVSNFGRILSLNYDHTGKSKLLQPFIDKDGYLSINLWKDKKQKSLKVHRIVAETFIPNPENKPCINHKIEGDEGKTINIVFFNEDETIDDGKSTIEWVTVKENNNFGTRIERVTKANSKSVLQFTLDGEFVREWTSTMECGRNGFNQGSVAACCRGEQKKHKGYIWRYKE